MEQALHQGLLLFRINEGNEDGAFLHGTGHVRRGWLHGTARHLHLDECLGSAMKVTSL